MSSIHHAPRSRLSGLLKATLLAAGLVATTVPSAWAAGHSAAPAAGAVKVTPLGSHTGEFCALDRALIFEDPDGTRILYDAGRTVRGTDDPRLGRIDAVLLSHVHGDHLGDLVQATENAGTCGAPAFTTRMAPKSVTVDVTVGKKARLIVGAEMGKFFTARVREAGGQPTQVQLLRYGASTKVGGVSVSGVTAAHTNGLDPAFLGKEYADMLEANGLTAYLGPAGGYVLKFSNGLSVYLSGDTGIMADHDAVIRRFYAPQLVVLNIGSVFTTGPLEAAYVVNELVKPKAVIASHANEPATEGGKLRAGTKTETFMKATQVPVHLPLSGRTMEFNGAGMCTAGC